MEDLKIRATAHVIVKKYDENGVLVSKEEREVKLTEKEVESLWQSQKQE